MGSLLVWIFSSILPGYHAENEEYGKSHASVFGDEACRSLPSPMPYILTQRWVRLCRAVWEMGGRFSACRIWWMALTIVVRGVNLGIDMALASGDNHVSI